MAKERMNKEEFEKWKKEIDAGAENAQRAVDNERAAAAERMNAAEDYLEYASIRLSEVQKRLAGFGERVNREGVRLNLNFLERLDRSFAVASNMFDRYEVMTPAEKALHRNKLEESISALESAIDKIENLLEKSGYLER